MLNEPRPGRSKQVDPVGLGSGVVRPIAKNERTKTRAEVSGRVVQPATITVVAMVPSEIMVTIAVPVQRPNPEYQHSVPEASNHPVAIIEPDCQPGR